MPSSNLNRLASGLDQSGKPALQDQFPLETKVRRKTGRLTLGVVRGYSHSDFTKAAYDMLLVQWGASNKYQMADPSNLRIVGG